jgi:2-(1,2-epoxy-1,2-dihydrophenyl)acetyl-CoA isomerase
MSRGNVEVVRQPIAVRASSRRRLEERVALRFPRAMAFVVRAVWRLPSRSRLRRELVRHAFQLGLEAANRNDLEATFALYDPDVELVFAAGLVALGFEPLYHGREARVRVQQRWIAEWRDIRQEPEELIDLGDGRVLVYGRQKGSGIRSGAAIDNDWALLFTLSAGRVIREQDFLDHAEAFQASGLEPPPTRSF